jgi:pimeloyl-ACP methyl ester carboxylesterase
VAVSERSVQVAGVRLHVRESGRGWPLLLINGVGAHVDMWALMESALPDTRLIAFDAPGQRPLAVLLLTSLHAS